MQMIIRRLRSGVKIVVLSSSDRAVGILGALAAGVHGYIVKSARIDGVIERLAYIMSGEIYVPAGLADQVATSTTPQPAEATPVAAAAVKPGNGACQLSDRQRQVLDGLLMGLSNKQIARELKLAEGTVKIHIGALLRALSASNRAHVCRIARQAAL
jgi:DNA-binding NarL/FixJ family response regulator